MSTGKTLTYTFAIPTYNATVLNAQCLSSIRNYYPDVEILVCDDGSSPEIQKLLKTICDKYNAKLILNKFNYGFSYSVNRMLDQATGDIVMLCNNDIILTQDILGETTKIFEQDAQIGVMGYLLYYPNGRIQHGGYMKHSSSPVFFGHYGHNEQTNEMAETSRYSVGVTGALMAVRRKMIDDIGVYSPKYYLAYEDVEFCLRTWHCGWKIYYTADVSAIHAEGATRGKNEVEKKQKNCFKQEEISAQQYIRDLQKYDIREIERKVLEANNQQDNRRIVVFKRMHAMGDCIQLTGIIDRYKIDNPNDYIIVVTWHKYPFENNPNVDYITDDLNKVANYDQLYDFDMAYELQPEKHRISSYSQIVFGNDNIYVPKLYTTDAERHSLLNKMIKLNIDFERDKCVIIHPAVSWANRTISRNIWESVIEYLLDDGYKVFIVGKNTDVPICNREGVYILYDMLTLAEIRVLIQYAGLFIGVDSGLMHIAQTTSAKNCLIFTVADPKKVLVRMKNTAIVEPDTCKFCLHDKIGETNLKCQHGTNQCIKEITCSKIIEGVRKLC